MTELEDLKEEIKNLRTFVLDIRKELRELEAETRTDYYDNKLVEIEERLDKINEDSLVEAMKYLALQGNTAALTREDLYNVLARFKIM